VRQSRILRGRVMRFLLKGPIAAIALIVASPASAADLIVNGITYTLTQDSISADGLTSFFTLLISGENTASDTEGGRTGINAIAFNQPAPGTVVTGTMTSPSGFTFALGGLNANGCSGSGNFFCFDNTAIGPTPSTLLSGPLTFTFNVTADTAGIWANYANPDFKIDWVGTNNNYDLVSQPIPVNTNNGVPEPATWAMMLLGFGAVGYTMRRRRKVLLPQVA
jgi:hypothetical protein